MKSILLLSLLILPSYLLSQSTDHEKHDKIESLFIGHITSELDLSPAESQAFWPVYNAYRKSADAAKKISHSHRHDSGANTDTEALKILNDHLTADQQRLDLKRQLYKDLSSIISPLRILKLKSAEHQFRRQMFDRIKDKSGT